MAVDAPEMLSPEQGEAVRAYLCWQALASDLVCTVVARGVRHAPSRPQRKELLRQVRTEHSQSGWIIERVHELGGEVPERDPAMDELRDPLIALCDRGWIEFLAAGQVAVRGYMSPFLRVLPAVFTFDDDYAGFTSDVMVPEVRSHFRRAVLDLRAALATADDPAAALRRARAAEEEAFGLFLRFISLAFPPLQQLGADTATVPSHVEEERRAFWAELTEEMDLDRRETEEA